MEQTLQAINIGLFTDTEISNQPKDTYRFALNAVVETYEGDLGSLSTEAGNSLCVTLPNNYEIIGSRFLGDNEHVLFLSNNQNSAIAIQKGCALELIIEADCLNFSKDWPMSVLSRIVRGCDRIVYFTDKNNPYRSINIDRLDIYKDDAGNWDCALFDHLPSVSYPNISVVSVNDFNGTIPVGAVQFAVQYLDESFNEVEWSYITNPVNIYDENVSANYSSIDGAWNGADGVRPDGVPLTNKSVSLEISNLDQKYAYIRVAAIHSSEGLGVPTVVYYTQEIGINGSTIDYLYTGNTKEYTIGSLLEVQTPRPYIETVGYHTQIDNRLILANTTGPKYDFCGFQRSANKIVSAWRVRQADVTNQTQAGNPKNPVDNKGFMADEIYAYGIVYVFNSGYHSPVFHIPGRANLVHDFILDTVGSTVPLEDVKHAWPNIAQGDTIRRWRWANTALNDGTMAFWRADNGVYPEDKDCDGNFVYGELAGQEIRHHKFPDRRLIRLVENQTAESATMNLFGVQFSEVEYPHEDIVGHYFVYVKRDETNSTVLDRGILSLTGIKAVFNTPPATVTLPSLNGIFPPGTYNAPTISFLSERMQFTSPKTLTAKEFLNGNYFKFEGKYRLDVQSSIAALDQFTPNTGIILQGAADDFFYTGFDAVTTVNRQYEQNFYVAPNSVQTGVPNFPSGGRVENRSYFNWANFYRLSDTINLSDVNQILDVPYDNAYLVANKIQRDVNTNLYALVYSRIHNGVIVGDTQETIWGGDAYISAIDYSDCHIKGGDLSGSGIDNIAAFKYQRGFWVESTVNFALRHGTSDPCNNYFKGDPKDFLSAYAIDRVADLIDGDYVYKITPCEEFYGYNKDYSKANIENPYFPLNQRYECCARCLESNPNRIWYSVSSNPANLDDGYKVIRANNIKDLYGEDLAISDLFVHRDNLYVKTLRSLYFLPTKSQTIQSNEAAIFVGTGEFLSLEPRRLVTTDYGYAGGSDEFARITTEFGTTFVDMTSRKVFNLTEGLEEISGNGMHNWFKENLQLSFLDTWATISDEAYPNLNTTGDFGVGIRGTYDPMHRRYILHKKDYRWIGKFPLVYRSGRLFMETGQTLVPVSFNNTQQFENKSFTISYNYLTKSWTSLHSYLPKMMYYDSDIFYSSIGSSSWKHGDRNFLSFYGGKASHIIELVVNANSTHTWVTDSIHYISKAKEFVDNQYNTVDNVTFNRFIAYNDYHTTGLKELVYDDSPYASLEYSNLVKYNETTWKLNDLYNYRTNYDLPLFTNNWSVISGDYYIDKVPTPGALLEKDIYELNRLRDKYLGLRLYYTPSRTAKDIKLTTNVVGTLKRSSKR